MEDRCISCGAIIPEGRQVCVSCEKGEVKLKPCPFCGSEDIRKTIILSYCEIYCGECMAGIQRALYMGKYECLEEAEADFGVEATKAWNRRTGK